MTLRTRDTRGHNPDRPAAALTTATAAAALTLASLLPATTAAQGAAEFVVNTTTAGNQDTPDVGLDPAGNFTIVWSGPDGDGSGVFGRRYGADGTPLGAEFRINPLIAGEQRDPAIAVDGSGRFVVAYTAADSDGTGIYARRYDASGGALDRSPIRINLDAAQQQRQADVAATADGATIFAWHELDASGAERIEVRRYAASGKAITGDLVAAEIESGPDGLFRPSVAVQPDGSAAVAYEDSFRGDETGVVVVVTYSADGSPIEQNTVSGRGQYNPSIAAGGGGYVVATDDSVTDSDDDYVYYVRLNREGRRTGDEKRVSQIALGNADSPAVAATPSGELAIVCNVTTSASNIHGRRYAADDTATTPFTRLNAPGSRNRHDAAVALAADGSGVAVWTDGGLRAGEHGLDGDLGAIVARRFPAIP